MSLLLLLVALIGSFPALYPAVSRFVIAHKRAIDRVFYTLSFACVAFVFAPQTIKLTGEQALGLLWFLLWLPILSRVFGVRMATIFLWFRQSIGVLMGMLALVHSVQFFVGQPAMLSALGTSSFWMMQGTLSFLWAGLLAMILVFVLLITSNRASMRFLGQWWKRLRRLVYLALFLTIAHVILIKYAKRGVIDSGELVVPVLYILAKIAEWRGVTLQKLRARFRS